MAGPEGRNPQLDEYIAKASDFAHPIFEHLRDLIHGTCPSVREEIKWGIPHFDYHGEMMCIFAAYGRHCSFSFWKESVMDDPRLRDGAGLPAVKRFMGRLTAVSDLPADAELAAMIREAMSLNERGIKPVRPEKPAVDKTAALEVPEELARGLEGRPEAKAVFEAKSASFRKEYSTWIADAKTQATRDKRVEEAVGWIAEGKGRFWKYQK